MNEKSKSLAEFRDKNGFNVNPNKQQEIAILFKDYKIGFIDGGTLMERLKRYKKEDLSEVIYYLCINQKCIDNIITLLD